MLKSKFQKGFSIAEIVVASSVLALLVTAFVGVFNYSHRAMAMSSTRNRAVFLAEEGLEAVRNIRDDDFLNLINGDYGLAVSGGAWIFSGTEDRQDIFTRQINISTLNSNTKEIRSTVSWDDHRNDIGSISLNTYLSYWQKENIVLGTCNDHCVSLDYTGGVCRANDTECVSNGEVFEQGGNSSCGIDPQQNVCCCSPHSSIQTCNDYCRSMGYVVGVCRQNAVQCGHNGQVHQSDGDVYCTNGSNVDTCCCN